MHRHLFSNVLVATALALSLLMGGPAIAGCKPQTLITSINTVPVKNDLAMVVPTTVKGTRVDMLLDTGGFFSELTAAAVHNLKLGTRHSRLTLVGVSADQTNLVAHVESFALGRLRASSIDFMVRKDPRLHDAGIDGILAPNLLSHYDLDLDFRGHKLNLISPDHCRGKVIYWPATAVAAAPIRVANSGHIIVPVMLDGVRVKAMLDTGATYSTLNSRIAEGPFNLKLGSAVAPAIGALPGRPEALYYHHLFKRLDFQGVAVSKIDLRIIPDLMHNWLRHAPPTGSRLSGQVEADGLPDLLLGMDVLRHLHIYIAYKEEMLYVTPASSPASKTAQSAARPADTAPN